jgi:2-C-methyl-D-erythritol 4-phosphate cytidylyltransferase
MSSPVFSVLVLTAPPPGLPAEAGGAYVKIDGREALLRSVELFLNRDNVKQIQLAVLPEMAEEAKRKYGAHLGFSGVKLLTAGPRWADQLAAAADRIAPEATHVLVHDAARPAVPYSDIDALMDEAPKHDATVLAALLRSALVEVDEGGNPLAYRRAAEFMALLTPQAFSKAKFEQMAKSGKDLHASEASLVKASPLNVRVGGGVDAGFVKAMIAMLPKPKMKPPSSPFEEAQW